MQKMFAQVLAHRGIWDAPEQGNRWPALAGAWRSGWGLETDLRDYRGEVVVCHDMPAETLREPIRLKVLADCYVAAGQPGWLALNIKSDGLASAIASAVWASGLTNYFCFDMSIPDTLPYLRNSLRVFMRQSEFEPEPALYTQAAGIWLDSFEGDWFEADLIRQHLRRGKHVCVVSPELHRRDEQRLWRIMEAAAPAASPRAQLMICTDKPSEFSRLPCASALSSSTWMAS
jgi:hypothetical protein